MGFWQGGRKNIDLLELYNAPSHYNNANNIYFRKKSSLFITKAFKNCSSILSLRDFKVHLTGFLAREKLAPERKLVSMDLS